MRAVMTITLPAAVGIAVLGGAGPASAADHHKTHDEMTQSSRHHAPDARVRKARHDQRVADRRAERRALKLRGTTTTPGAHTTGTTGTRPRNHHPATGAVVPCTVTADRPATVTGPWVITNTCDHPVTVDYVVQAYAAGAYDHGICKATGHCWVIRKGTLTAAPGTHGYLIDAPGCWVQIDLKVDGRLIKAGHYGTSSCKHDGPPPVHHRPVPPVQHSPHQPTHPHARVRLTSSVTTADALPRTGGFAGELAIIGAGLIGLGALAKGAGRLPAQQERAIRAGVATTRSRRAKGPVQ